MTPKSRRKHPRSPIGCAITDRDVRLAQQREDAFGTRRIVAACHTFDQTKPAERDVTCAVERARAQADFIGREVVCCVPDRLVSYRHMRMVPMPEADLAQAVYWQTLRDVNGQANDLQSAYFNVGNVLEAGEQRNEVISVSASIREVEQLVEQIEHAALMPIAIDAWPAALARCIDGSDNDGTLVLAIGVGGSMLLVVQHGQPRFIRTITHGTRQIVTRAAEIAGDPNPAKMSRIWSAMDEHRLPEDEIRGAVERACQLAAQDLAHEVGLSMHHLSTSASLDSLPSHGCVIGAGAAEPSFRTAISESAGIELRNVNELLRPDMTDVVRQSTLPGSVDGWLAAIGLSLYSDDVCQASEIEAA